MLFFLILEIKEDLVISRYFNLLYCNNNIDNFLPLSLVFKFIDTSDFFYIIIKSNNSYFFLLFIPKYK